MIQGERVQRKLRGKDDTGLGSNVSPLAAKLFSVRETSIAKMCTPVPLRDQGVAQVAIDFIAEMRAVTAAGAGESGASTGVLAVHHYLNFEN